MYIVYLDESNAVVKKDEVNTYPPSIKQIISVNKNVYNTIEIGWSYNNGQWTPPEVSFDNDNNEDPIINQIEMLKQELRNTDWIVVEVLEHQLAAEKSPHDFDKIYEKRKDWRNKIRALNDLISKRNNE